MIPDELRNFLNRNRAKLFYALLFVIVGILIFAIGFWRTLILVFLGGVGWVVGMIIEDKDFIRKFLNNYFGK